MLAHIKDIPSLSLSHLLEEKFCISITDRQGTIMYVNQMFCNLSKYSEDELIGQNYGMLNPDYPSDFIPKLEKHLNKNKVLQQEIKSFTKDGIPYWVRATIVPILDENKKIIQFVSFDIDNTNTVLTEKK